MTQSTSSPEIQSRYLALINGLTESCRALEKLEAPSHAKDGLLDVIQACRLDYDKRFPSLAPLPTNGLV